MPEYFPENNTPLWSDTEVRSLQKISSSLDNLSTGGTGGIIGSFPTDSFGRLRVSEPFTLFDSSHRYRDNGLWSTYTSGTASATFNASQGLMDLTIGTANNDEIIRETTKVFSYQPGKSLLVMNTFVMSPTKTNLRQRVGYYGDDNGLYVELYGNALSLVERSLVTGIVTEIPVAQADWNGDKLDGTGPSGITLDITKAQIFWMDIEWLGLGTVRLGFIINGQFILCHSFHHANLITSTYITTASLPLRYEIKNIGVTSSSSNLKQVCSTVLSEGGYELRGAQQAVGTAVTSPFRLTTAGTFYPVVTLRLKSSASTPPVDRTDAVVIITALSLLGKTTGDTFNWQVRNASISSGGTWVSAGADSAVEYNLTATTLTTAGRIMASGYFSTTQQTGGGIDILKEALFANQLERNGILGTAFEFSVVCASNNNNADLFTSVDWEEISR
jgi:hypothetical protein